MVPLCFVPDTKDCVAPKNTKDIDQAILHRLLYTTVYNYCLSTGHLCLLGNIKGSPKGWCPWNWDQLYFLSIKRKYFRPSWENDFKNNTYNQANSNLYCCWSWHKPLGGILHLLCSVYFVSGFYVSTAFKAFLTLVFRVWDQINHGSWIYWSNCINHNLSSKTGTWL